MSKQDYKLQRQRGSPYYYADYAIWDGKKGGWVRKFTSTGTSNKREAEQIAAAYVKAAHAVAEGVVSGWSRQKALDILREIERAAGLQPAVIQQSWKQFAEAWLRLRSADVKDATLKIYTRQLARFETWLGPRADHDLCLLTGLDLQTFYNSLKDKGLIPTTARLYIVLLTEMFEQARNEGWSRINPAALVKLSGDKRQKIFKEGFSADEVKKILKTAAVWPKDGEEWVTMILSGVCTGARLRDCVNFGVSNIDRTDDVWILKFTPKKTEKFGTVVTVPVVEPLRSHLAKLIKAGKSLLFCPHLAQGGIVGEHSAEFGKILKAAGITQRVTENAITKRKCRSKTFHSLRHTLPSWLQASGVDEETRMKIIGHSSKTVHKGYTHIEMQALSDALNKGLAKIVG